MYAMETIIGSIFSGQEMLMKIGINSSFWYISSFQNHQTSSPIANSRGPTASSELRLAPSAGSWWHLRTCPPAASSLLLSQRLDPPQRVLISIMHLIRLIFIRSRWSGEDHFGISFVLFVFYYFI